MPMDNFTRMIQLANEFFDAKNDPAQLDIDESVIERLKRIHPATMGEMADENGPIAWTIVIPATRNDMQQFLDGKINETTLLERSEKTNAYEAIYLCSAMVLAEHRRKGLAKQLLCDSVRAIQKDYHITALFYWGFSKEGNALSRAVASEVGLPVLERLT